METATNTRNGQNYNDLNMTSQSMHFLKMYLRDYGVFRGVSEIEFNRNKTLIVGKAGAGKTTIRDVLEKCGLSKGVQINIHPMYPEMPMTAEVLTEGDPKLIEKYRDIIFFGSNLSKLSAFTKQIVSLNNINCPIQKRIRNEMCAIYRSLILNNPSSVDPEKNLNPESLSAGERACLIYLYIFAFRHVMKLNLPVVIDSPYSLLDELQKDWVSSLLKGQPYQQIVLRNDNEFEEDEPHYRLVNAPGYSRVMKAM